MICNVSVSVAIFSVLVSVPTYRMEQVNPDALSLTVTKEAPSSRTMSLHF